jgi:epoxyqueuosine reductase
MAGHIARYALGEDYHLTLDAILRSIESAITASAPDVRTRRYVDTGPLSDRALAVDAGLGWVGKNAMVIDPERGSWFFVGVLLTSLENDMEVALVADRCGACTRCIDACPTGAILPGRIVASERCLSHATIEQRGALDAWIGQRLEGNIFGCDICQEVCPWNEAPPEPHPAFLPRPEYRARPVSALLKMSQHDFSALFTRSAVKRAKRVGMIRNAILAGATIDEEARMALVTEGDPGILAALESAGS